jgi:hypothetical protein
MNYEEFIEYLENTHLEHKDINKTLRLLSKYIEETRDLPEEVITADQKENLRRLRYSCKELRFSQDYQVTYEDLQRLFLMEEDAWLEYAKKDA